ncbi:MAG: hypothetical protein H8F28_11470 [Fibrella sp.]|nr:hypothetical protein [Armatimonadota bacterium]
MNEQQKRSLMIAGAVVAIVAAIAFVTREATKPTETINKFEDVPAKGIDRNAGKAERKER